METPSPMDYLLCSGNGSLSKKIILFNKVIGIKGPAQEISHVAQMSWNGLVSESTTFNEWADKSGVQLNQFAPWHDNYDGDIYRRRYLGQPRMHRKALKQYDKDSLGIPYEHGIPGFWELFKAGLGIGDLESTSNIHCSENNTRKAKVCQFLPQSIPDYLFSPAQYYHDMGFDQNVKAHHGMIMWGPAEQIK